MVQAVAGDQVIMCHLVEIGFKDDLGADQSVYLTDAAIDITYESQVYSADGLLSDIVDVSDKGDISGSSPTIKLSGTAQTILGLIQLGNINNGTVKVTRLFLDMDFSILDNANYEPVIFYEGSMRQPTLQIAGRSGKATLSIKTENKWVKFKSPLGRALDYDDHQRYFPGDLSMQFATSTLSTFR